MIDIAQDLSRAEIRFNPHVAAYLEMGIRIFIMFCLKKGVHASQNIQYLKPFFWYSPRFLYSGRLDLQSILFCS